MARATNLSRDDSSPTGRFRAGSRSPARAPAAARAVQPTLRTVPIFVLPALLIFLTPVLASPLSGLRPQTPEPDFDVLIRNGRVLDGTGNPAFSADVGIRGDQIAAIGDLSDARGRRDVDAAGRYVTPGFVTMHDHIDGAILEGHGRVPNYTTQGFTTSVINMDGRTRVWPISTQRDSLEKMGTALNLVQMVGHGTVRNRVMGTDPDDVMRFATADELEEMKTLVRQGMEEGAFGMSTGLEYNPMRYSSREEVLELARAVAPYGGHVQFHMRSQGRYPQWQVPSHMDHPVQRHVTWMDAIMEILTVAEDTGVPVTIDHIHPVGPREWGMSYVTTRLIDEWWRKGHEVYVDMHSYEGYSTYVTLVPRWALVKEEVPAQSASDDFPPVDYTDMRGNLQRRLRDPELREMIKRDAHYEIIRQGGADGLIVVDYTDPDLVGMTLAEVAEMRGESLFDTVIWLQMNGLDQPGGVLWMAEGVGMIDIENWMRQDYTAVCLDRGGDTGDREDKSTHPGEYGTSARLIREFVFERGTITLPHAIRSLSGLGAQILGLRDRGTLVEGKKADVVVFDPETIRTEATYLDPYVYQEGMTHVLVNGEFVVDGGEPTEALPGRVLERERE